MLKNSTTDIQNKGITEQFIGNVINKIKTNES